MKARLTRLGRRQSDHLALEIILKDGQEFRLTARSFGLVVLVAVIAAYLFKDNLFF